MVKPLIRKEYRSGAEGIRTPYPSAVQKRHDTLLEMSGACKTAANIRIFRLRSFPSFQEIYSGCCTRYARQDPNL
jgi:hypothetical protein